METWLKIAVKGAAAGAAATLPMALVQIAAYHAGLAGTVPPDQVTRSFLGRMGLKPQSKTTKTLAVAVSHLGYGAAAGAGFALARKRLRPPGSPILHGAAYGLLLWAVSYVGWVPAAGILPPPQHARKAGVAANVLAHLLYGAVVGWLVGLSTEP